jgi:hypothetical protein
MAMSILNWLDGKYLPNNSNIPEKAGVTMLHQISGVYQINSSGILLL